MWWRGVVPSLLSSTSTISSRTCCSIMSLSRSSNVLSQIGIPPGDCHDLPTSTQRFPDGAQFRIEIPSTEGVEALKAVVEEGKKYKVPIHRVSQGTGMLLMTDGEIKDMLRIGRDNRIEVCLFVGPRNAWDTSATARTEGGRNSMVGHRGHDALGHAIEDVLRGVELGVRSVLVNDIGLLSVIQHMKKQGKLPPNLVCKTSVQIGPGNGASAAVLRGLGAGTINPPTDLSLAQLCAMRGSLNGSVGDGEAAHPPTTPPTPMDIYVEAPDSFGGYVRYYELPDMVRCLAPMYVKLGLRNSPDIYPAGTHIQDLCVSLSRERVRRARIALDTLYRFYPEAVCSHDPRHDEGGGGVGGRGGGGGDNEEAPPVLLGLGVPEV